MTIDEALEYLNLPANSRRQLVRKRYLELKNDYLKAIYNAPSNHFSILYQEHLRKIEEAYSFLMEQSKGIMDRDSPLQQTILQIQQMINSFLEEGKILDNPSREKLKSYIEQIDRLKDTITNEPVEAELSQSLVPAESQNRPVWHWEAEKLKKSQTITSHPKKVTQPVQKTSPTGIEEIVKWIERILKTPYPETIWGRRFFYDRLLMGVILAIVVMGILGCIYVIFPLLFL